MQSDGNFVLYHGATALWASNTNGTAAVMADMQSDGNLVVYTSSLSPLWDSATEGNPGAFLTVQNDGNLVIDSASGSVLWQTGTWGSRRSAEGATPPLAQDELTNHGLCMDIRGNDLVDFDPVQLYTCNDTGAQLWTFGNPSLQIQPTEDTNWCLGSLGGVTNVNGTPVVIYQCNGTAGETWYTVDGTITNGDGECLDDTNGGGSGTQLQIWACTAGDPNQQFLAAASEAETPGA
jgi:hypothetical protein